MTLVLDASLVTAGLTIGNPDALWARRQLKAGELVAPHLMPLEVASAIRWAEIRGEIPAEAAWAAHADLLTLDVELFPYSALGERIWELRANVTAADAWYVALAEWLDAPLATLDRRLTRASGPRCVFLTPETAP